ncbi:MAG: hypothetical protein JSR60_13775 [Proteobacteria bacterium]|nr:hypothetical protein [Pseudomonadota bacterium]
MHSALFSLPQWVISYRYFMCFSSHQLAPLDHYRDRVAAAIEVRGTWADRDARDLRDVHIASSCLQKALRRADREHAQAAAAMLLQQDPERLWRRLCVCAFEDFGQSDLHVTAEVVAVVAGRNFRKTQGEARILRYLIDRLCETPKDRRLDDLYAIAAALIAEPKRHPDIARMGGSLSETVVPLVLDTRKLLVTCERPVPRRSFRALVLDACERALDDMAGRGLADAALVELCWQGARLSKCLLPVLLPLGIAATEACGGLGEVFAEPAAEVPSVGDIPGYAIDGFTRSGRMALTKLAAQEPRLQAILTGIPRADRLDVLHHMLFFVEGGRCASWHRDELSDALWCEALACGTRMPIFEARAALAVFVEHLPALHDLRRVELKLQIEQTENPEKDGDP